MINTLCCINSPCLKKTCFPLRKIFGTTINHEIKLAYFFCTTFIIILLPLLKYDNPSQEMLESTGCTNSPYQNRCVFIPVIIRLFISLSITYLLLALGMFIHNQKAKAINEGLWFVKLFVFVMLFLLSSFLGMGIIDFMYRICLQCWVVYCFLQSVAIIDLLYSITSRIKERIDQSTSHIPQIINALLILSTYGLCIYLNVITYNKFPKWVSILNSCAIGIGFLIALVNINPMNTILMSGFCQLYMQGLSFIVMDQDKYSWKLEWLMLGMLFMTFASLLHRGSGRIKTRKSSLNHLLGMTTQHSEEAGYISTDDWKKFHILMAIFAVSLPVILTQWRFGWVSQQSQLPNIYCSANLIAAYVIYLWSIVSIRCCPDKDMTELQSYFKEFELN